MPSMPPVHFATPARRVLRTLLTLIAATPLGALAQTSPVLSTIVAFSGSQASSNAVRGPDGALYGTTSATSIVTGGLIYRAAADGSSVRTIYQLTPNDGLNAVAGLLLGSDGRLYGSTTLGAASQLTGAGTVFRVSPDGTGFQVIHRFASYTIVNTVGAPVNADGANPEAELVEGADGYLYGVTRTGGPNGTGVVFKLSKDGTGFSVLHAFGPVTSEATATPIRNADGLSPVGALLAGADNYFYGTASAGGANGNGTLFRVRFDGTGFETLYVFSALVANPNGLSTNGDGATPIAGLTDGKDGRFYGVTNLGGPQGNGTVFSYDPVANLLTTMHAFDGTKGARPTGELLLMQNGGLFGTTVTGGTNASGATTTAGTIFTIARDGTGFTSLKSFQGADGSSPTGRPLQLDASTFVGLAAGGGKCGQGLLYYFSLTGSEIKGVTNCGQRRNNGGGSVGPALFLLLGSLLLRRRGAH
jgi:uncharacterized repeat protein (TIGR03803 family)